MNGAHVPVLLSEALDALQIDSAGTYVDATFGRGGHSRAILSRLGPHGRLLAFDRDPAAVAAAQCIGDARFTTFADVLPVATAGASELAPFKVRQGLQSRPIHPDRWTARQTWLPLALVCPAYPGFLHPCWARCFHRPGAFL